MDSILLKLRKKINKKRPLGINIDYISLRLCRSIL